MDGDIEDLVQQHNKLVNPAGTAYAAAAKHEADTPKQAEEGLPFDRTKALPDLPQQPKSIADMPDRKAFEVKATKTSPGGKLCPPMCY